MKNLRRCIAAVTAGLLLVTAPALALAVDLDLGADAPTATGIAWDDEAERLFVADESGAIRVVEAPGVEVGEVAFSGEPQSVQALALDAGVLHVADIGDVSGDRDLITVFGVTAEPGQQGYRAWDFVYPDGPQDATAFLISGRGRFYFITTGADPGIYGAQLEPSREGTNTLFRAADAPEGVTDAVFLDDGETMLVRTAQGVEAIDAFSWETSDTTTYSESPDDESITTYGDGRMLVGPGAHFRDEPLPDGDQTVTPAVPAEPTPSEEPSETATDPGEVPPTEVQTQEPGDGGDPTEQGGTDENVTTGVARGGTYLAIGGAVLVAVVAGVAVFVSKD